MLNSKTLGLKIVEARKNQNLSQADLAEQLCISPQAVGKWERGESLPDFITLNQIAKIFQLDLNYFSDDFGSNEPEIAIQIPASKEQPATIKNKRLGLKWNMSRGNWVDADFSDLNNLQEKFNGSNMRDCQFQRADLTELQFDRNNIEKCNFTEANLRNSHISESNISNSIFEKSDWTDAQFTHSNLEKNNFNGCNFSGAEFKGVNFGNNTLENAHWNLTSFQQTNLSNLIFSGSIDGCSFDTCSFHKVTFQNVKITNTFFKGRKLKGINFKDCQVDKLSYEFLKNARADVSNLTHLEVL